MPGCSVEHYIVMVDFILRSLDGDPSSAVAAVAVDYSKAYNRMLHSNILCSLSALNVPTGAIKLIKLYLTSRTMCVRYKEATFCSNYAERAIFLLYSQNEKNLHTGAGFPSKKLM